MRNWLGSSLGLALMAFGGTFCAADGPALMRENSVFEADVLRFVYKYGNQCYIDIIDRERDTFSEFAEEFSPLPQPTSSLFVEMLPQEQSFWILERIPERIHERYLVYEFKQKRVSRFEMIGLTLSPTGDGGFNGFFGVLKPVGKAPHEELGNVGLRPLGVAVRDTKRARRAVADFSRQHESDASANTEDARGFLSSAASVGLHDVQAVGALRVKDAEAVTILTASNDAGEGLLFAAAKLRGQWAVVPFVESTSDSRECHESLVIEDIGESDVSMHDTRILIVPDIDGSGKERLMVISTVSQVFEPSLESRGGAMHWSLLGILKSYFGP